jgi:hypothetical protein
VRSGPWPFAAAALAAAVTILAQRELDRRAGALGAEQEALYLWRGEQVKRLFPGFENLAADLYWLRTVQYFGAQKAFATEQTFDLLRPLVDITTSLDPRMEIAYRYGAIFLCEPRPQGAGRPEEGVAILEKGVRSLPDSWRLRQDLGFFIFIYLHDPDRAAAVLDEAARLPGAAFWLKGMAADILDEGGQREKARRMWARMFEQAEPGSIKENAKTRLQVYDAQDLADLLEQKVAEFTRRFGRRPHALAELRADGVWTGPLADPTGVAFEYDARDGKVNVSTASSLWRPGKGPGQ